MNVTLRGAETRLSMFVDAAGPGPDRLVGKQRSLGMGMESLMPVQAVGVRSIVRVFVLNRRDHREDNQIQGQQYDDHRIADRTATHRANRDRVAAEAHDVDYFSFAVWWLPVKTCLRRTKRRWSTNVRNP